MKSLKQKSIFIILISSLVLSACTLNETVEQKVESSPVVIEEDDQDDPIPELTTDENAEKDNEESNEEADLFADAHECVLTPQDYTFEYNGNTFGIDDNWNDYVDKLGYPEHFEENNYGYINTNEDGYWWEMIYPDQSHSDYDFHVVFISPSLEREGEDTIFNNIALNNTPTFRGIKSGDSLESLASVYGRPDSIDDFGNDLGWMNVIYEDERGQIVFVTDRERIIYTILKNKD